MHCLFRQLKLFVDDVVENAVTSNSQAQQDCYGIGKLCINKFEKHCYQKVNVGHIISKASWNANAYTKVGKIVQFDG